MKLHIIIGQNILLSGSPRASDIEIKAPFYCYIIEKVAANFDLKAYCIQEYYRGAYSLLHQFLIELADVAPELEPTFLAELSKQLDQQNEILSQRDIILLSYSVRKNLLKQSERLSNHLFTHHLANSANSKEDPASSETMVHKVLKF